MSQVSDNIEFLKALPKCEHHIHIEGSLSPELLFQLSAKNNIPLPESDAAYSSIPALHQRYADFQSLDDFLGYYYTAMSTLIHASDFEALAMAYFTRAAADGVLHTELSFDPQAHTSRGIALTTVLTGLSAARARAASELGVSSVLICCFLRHLPVHESLVFFESEALQQAFASGEVVGIGLDSSEAGFPARGFEDLYTRARALGLRVTAHAGEEVGPESVREALDVLRVERVDHGISLVQDEALMRRVAEEGVMLSCCPLSNVVLRNVKSVADVPLRVFLEKGVRFSVNSDDPAYFGGYILDNFVAVQKAFGLSVEEWRTVVTNSVEGSWCDQARKSKILERLEMVVEQYTLKA
ncbi:adenosine deaminase [Pseudovirgaria hyperparasitica]|uniref:Adenine deaminase n=1 Tax=Pseudovirgaria hyperparasitica TaxID=470096 RepID=A0A6A6W5D6_9PEZI|nr:adenosine deaminase [Pseudovirgaria hyperparasitica]KAF2757166.1 adenosine deaminase [Pseudovirgaria hyperparasitica]